MNLIEPISRKLMQLGRLYLSVLAKNTAHLNVTRYHYILTLINHHDGQLTQKALGEMLNKDKSAMVSIIDLLATKGLVYRETNAADRREHLLRVTEKGKKAIPHIVDSFKDINKHITQGISKTEMQIFENVLQKMQNNLQPLTAANAILHTKPHHD